MSSLLADGSRAAYGTKLMPSMPMSKHAGVDKRCCLSSVEFAYQLAQARQTTPLAKTCAIETLFLYLNREMRNAINLSQQDGMFKHVRLGTCNGMSDSSRPPASITTNNHVLAVRDKRKSRSRIPQCLG
jgi:hypothetical protein